LVSIADSKGTIHNPKGLNVSQLIAIKEEGGSVMDYPDGDKGDSNAVIATPCELWIPAARPDVIHANNVSELKAKLIIQGANIPITEEAELILFEQGVHVIPDFIANSGGVICASVEYHGGTEQSALEMIRQKISFNTKAVITQAKAQNIPARQAAEKMAVDRIKKAMRWRRG
jgi:glutamate dehydrogenase (NAD(P)+)